MGNRPEAESALRYGFCSKKIWIPHLSSLALSILSHHMCECATAHGATSSYPPLPSPGASSIPEPLPLVWLPCSTMGSRIKLRGAWPCGGSGALQDDGHAEPATGGPAQAESSSSSASMRASQSFSVVYSWCVPLVTTISLPQ